jgi:hypothetical protein
MSLGKATTIGVLAFGAALALCGCGPEARPEGKPPTEEPAKEVRAVKHADLQQIEAKLQESLGTSGPAAGLAAPNFPDVFAGAEKIAKGADAILEDVPATLTDEQRQRFEGFVAQLKQKAADLQAAAEQQQIAPARRSHFQLKSSCVKCHDQFRSAAHP